LLLVLASLGYVGSTLWSSGVFSSSEWLNPALWARTAVGALVYSGALFLVALAWVRLLGSVTPLRIRWAEGVRIYAVTQLLKYVPSNVLHYAGRQVLLRRRGVEHSAAAWTSAAEAATIVVGACVVSLVFGGPYFASKLLAEGDAWLVLATVALGLVAAGAVAAIAWRRRLQESLARYLSARARRAMVEALALHVLFFVLAGCVFAVLARSSPTPPSFRALVAVAAGSWVVGFVTPGMSAGIGVREAAMIGSLGPVGLDAGEAALLALAYRVATVLGDLLFATWGELALSRTASS
jgi:uncharacterized membrane protein YbhN (UPF0104 family)